MSDYASPADIARYGAYSISRRPDDTRPLYRFGGRLSSDGSTPYPAVPDRYHVYAGWFCPWSQRITLAVELAGLSGIVGVSHVDSARDARGWAFRQTHGPDPVNGFTLLRDAYEHTEPGFDGHISVPVLWDRTENRIVSNDFGTLDIDLASQYDVTESGGIELYPPALRAQIDDLETWLRADVNGTADAAASGSPEAAATLKTAFADLDGRLAHSRFLLGDAVTLADTRLFVTLVRYDAAAARSGAPRLREFGELWRYARDLYALPAFTATTDFGSFAGGDIVVADWRNPVAADQ
ncbi:glutathione S-transferase C-terminal domain-containing protein [Gordonia sp. KTR9]|uniref:glutathione S-transferase C-terminal domain-containing protein n=1 Tax=Gordonia sp. KTR9 TaxID=337191 RepID=UPI00027DDE1D|nr:glutathione S-transferase C-terminal domain-containing protein [Gordonia sp. KTR9]AFR47279.1 putative glutathione S-transferase [Gordonia sp. KTR9]